MYHETALHEVDKFCVISTWIPHKTAVQSAYLENLLRKIPYHPLTSKSFGPNSKSRTCEVHDYKDRISRDFAVPNWQRQSAVGQQGGALSRKQLGIQPAVKFRQAMMKLCNYHLMNVTDCSSYQGFSNNNVLGLISVKYRGFSPYANFISVNFIAAIF